MSSVLATLASPSYPSVDPFDRERRFVLERLELERFMATIAVRMRPIVYDTARPLAYTRTTYLDSDDLAYLRSSDGPIARRLRVREYAVATDPGAPPTLTGLCFLELKETIGAARSKVRFEAPAAVIARLIAAQSHPSPVGAPWPIQEVLARTRVAPRLSTWYRRTCFGGIERLRVTLDEELSFALPVTLGQPGDSVAPAAIVAYGPGRLLEVKSLGPLPDWLEGALAPLSEVQFSKFCLGMKAVQSGAEGRSRYCRPEEDEPRARQGAGGG